MVLYRSQNKPRYNWIVEADLSDTDISDIFFQVVEHISSTAAIYRRDEKWQQLKADNSKLYDGELISMRDLRKEDGQLVIGIRKSSYTEHHGSCPFEGSSDEYTDRFFPYDFEVQNGVAIPKIPNFNDLFPSFSVATLVETSDNRIIYLERSSHTDNYKDTLSLNSGGRINGEPHQMVGELIDDSSSIYRHITGMLQMEYGKGLTPDSIQEHRLTGVARCLDDLDVTLCVYTRIKFSYSQLRRMFKEFWASAEIPKYSAIHSVSANADGIVSLLRKHDKIPGSGFPVIVQAASIYGVNPKEVLPSKIKEIT